MMKFRTLVVGNTKPSKVAYRTDQMGASLRASLSVAHHCGMRACHLGHTLREQDFGLFDVGNICSGAGNGLLLFIRDQLPQAKDLQ